MSSASDSRTEDSSASYCRTESISNSECSSPGTTHFDTEEYCNGISSDSGSYT